MSDLPSRALRKRIHLRSQFTYPVLVEHVTVDEGMALVRVRRPDGGMADVTLEVAELEEALAAASGSSAEMVSGRAVFDALEAVRIRLAYAYDPYFAVSLSGVRARRPGSRSAPRRRGDPFSRMDYWVEQNLTT